jgi:pimeloyl-ACP methyl ester carboxylesterase
MSSLPTLVLVPGAFGTPAGYKKLLPYFEDAGFTTIPGPYPSCDPVDPASATAPKDIESLRQSVLLPLIEQGKDVVILAHSYGGVVAGGAAKSLDKPTCLSQGYVAGVVGLIYVAGNITLENESLLEAVGGAYPPFIKLDKVFS